MGKPIRLLIVADTESSARILARELERGGFEPSWERVETTEAMNAALDRTSWDVVLADDPISRISAHAALEVLKGKGLDLPFIVVTDANGEDSAVELIQAGSHDYVLKDRLSRLAPAVERERREAENRREQRRVAKALLEGEKRFRDVAENALEWIWEVDLQGRYIYSSPIVEKIFGYTPEEILEKHFYDLSFPEDRKRVKKSGLGFIAAGRSFRERVVRCMHKNGEPVWVMSSGVPVGDEAGNIVGYRGGDIDITRYRKDEDALRASEERLRVLYEHAPDAIYVTDLKGNFIDGNLAAEKVTGYKREELIGKTFLKLKLLPLRQIPKAASLLARNALGKPTGPDVFTLHRKDDSSVVVEIRTFPIKIGNDRLVLGIARDISERRLAEKALRESELRFRAIFDNASDGILLADLVDWKFITGNRAICRMLGYSEDEIKTLNIQDIHPAEEWSAVSGRIEQQLKGENILTLEVPLKRKDGSVFHADVNSAPITLGKATYLMGMFRDVTERKHLEDQLRQAQKMEAIGRLAGGLSHDFTNLMTIVTALSDLLLRSLDEEDPNRRRVEEIRNAGRKAVSLTRQLLAFSRKQILQPKILDLNMVVTDLEKMLKRLIGEDIDLVCELDPLLGNVQADPGQIEQIIMNLAVNARDAMPSGGKLILKTADAELDEEYAERHIGAKPGSYVMLAISDSGCGMDEETCLKIFEPFFTTKDVGKGTGLGLSTVYGIVKQSGGNIWVTSEPGKGTTFEIFLPRLLEAGKPSRSSEEIHITLQGSETILLVEDDEPVRTAIKIMLEVHEYKVLETGTGEAALDLLRSHGDSIHLLITDVVMPGMRGTEIASQGSAILPGLKVLFMSGYPDDAIRLKEILDTGASFINKPFSADILAAKIREILDREEGREEAPGV